jgi:hypothetical protein
MMTSYAAEELERPSRRDATANRERLLAPAEKDFADQGLAAGVEEVARRCCVE